MNKLAIIFGVCLVCMGCAPVNKPPISAPETPAEAALAPMPVPVVPVAAPAKAKPLLTVDIYPGSLKENIERIAANAGWHQVVWDAPQDYMWVGHAQIRGENLSVILRRLLDDYPLQAVFYQGNHVLYIHPRTLK